jgi:hypothetical protein
MFPRFIAQVVLFSIAGAAVVLPVFAQSPVQSSAVAEIHNHSPLVTGNGFGFAVVNSDGEVVKLYAHPYRFERPNADITNDGPSTANLVKSFRLINGYRNRPDVSYVSQSQIISAKVRVRSVDHPARGHDGVIWDGCSFFMPFGLNRNALVAIGPSTTVPLRYGERPPEFEVTFALAINKMTHHNISGTSVEVVRFAGVPSRVVIVPLTASQQNPLIDVEKDKTRLIGRSWALLVLEDGDDVAKAVGDLLRWRADAKPDNLIKREVSQLESWRKRPTVSFVSDDERKLWRQNETILRMAQIQEDNREGRFNHGLILASLPDGVWFIPWVRDMSYALVGLTRMRHTDEAREGILALFNAHPVGLWKTDTRGADYQISVTRYYGDGSEEADYSGQKTENCEFDDWGLALWAVSEYWRKTNDLSLLNAKTYRGDTVYESMRDFIVKPLLLNMDAYDGGLIAAEDSSCWEEHQQNKHHYAYTTITAIAGLEGFLNIAGAMHDVGSVKLVQEKLPLLKIGFEKAFVKDGFISGIVESDKQPKSEIDGAVLEAFNFGIVRDPKVFEKTFAEMEKLKTASGGYRRNLGTGDYETHEFLMIDFNAARAMLKFGKDADAAKIITNLVSKTCQDNGLIPEMYVSAKARGYGDFVGDPTGAIPMVGFGSGAYVLTLTDRAAKTDWQDLTKSGVLPAGCLFLKTNDARIRRQHTKNPRLLTEVSGWRWRGKNLS